MYGGTARTFILLVVLQMLSQCQSQGASKRVPLGFQGMRGKKNVEYTDSEDFTGADVDTKRADDLEALKTNYKPDSLHFDSSVANDYLSDRVFFKRAPMGFMGMRGKKDTEGFGDDGLFLDTNPFIPGFFNNEINSDEAFPYDGMPLNPSFPSEYFQSAPIFDASQDAYGKSSRYWDNNFVGDHPLGPYPFEIGKPVLEGTQTGPVEDKRAPMNGFFGMRGKKSPLFGNGKKGPFDYSFRGKFVGVRGKKSSGRLDNPLHFLIKRLNNQLYWQKRRVPDGFLGMRGKKWIKSVLSAPTTHPVF